MRVLLTNDDGIEAEGLQTLRIALLRHNPGMDLLVIAPDGNRSAMARSITTRRPLWVRETPFGDGTVGYATDGTPVDCVRLADLGLVKDWSPDLIVSGINHGANLGDDITYSGTVAAALEGIILGIPGIAASQEPTSRRHGIHAPGEYDFSCGADFIGRLVADLDSVPLPRATLLNVNFPGTEPTGVAVTKMGRRIYSDVLTLEETDPERGSLYRIYGEASHDPGEVETDNAAVAAGQIAITPLHFDLTHHESLEALAAHDLDRLLHERAV